MFYVLADLGQLIAATAWVMLRSGDDVALARQMRRERLRGRLFARALRSAGFARGVIGFGVVFAAISLHLIHLEFEQIEEARAALGGLAVSLAPQPCNFVVVIWRGLARLTDLELGAEIGAAGCVGN